jgi:chemotaxis protein histidine kinase CheA
MASTSAVEFFILEATGYIDGLDALLGAPGERGPDRDALVRLTRALRGNSVMYRQPGVTTVATALESCARALRDGRMSWSPQLHQTLVSTVDDLRVLVRNVRQWSAEDDRRANERARELESIVPHSPTPSSAVQAATEAGGRAYLANKTRELAATVERVSANPSDSSARAALERDVRALSGVALLKEYPLLSIVVAALERESASLGTPSAATEEMRGRLRHTAKALGEAASALSAGDPASAERALRDVARELESAQGGTPSERIVSIEELFYADAGPTILEASSSPPTSAAQRFRIEIIGLAEHARRVIGDVRRAQDDMERDRGWRALERAFASLVDTARSFGEAAVARALGAWESAVSSRDEQMLGSLDEAAMALTDPDTPASSLQQRLEQLAGMPPAEEAEPEAEAADITSGQEPATTAAPEADETEIPAPPGWDEAPPAPRRPVSRTPTGSDLREMLASGISGLSGLDQRPLAQPVPLPTERIVPIETLVYTGEAALRRAREIRDEIRAKGSPPEPEMLDELFALLDLVKAE